MKATTRSVAVLIAACVGLWSARALAQDNLWTGGVGGNWTDASWNQGGPPDATFDDRGIIGSTADLSASIIGEADVTTSVTTPSVVLGDGNTTSGTLNISSGGTFTVVPGAGGSPSNIDVGLSGGVGFLNVAGTLIADRIATPTSGDPGSTITLSGSATATLGEAFLDRQLVIDGSSVSMSFTDDVILGFAGTHTWRFPAAGTPSLVSIGGNADLGGTLRIEFTGGTPAPGATFDLIDAATIDAFDAAPSSFNNVETTADAGLAPGEVYAIQNVAGGTNGVIARLAREQRPVLMVDRQTGAVSIDNPGTSASILIDAYVVGSPTVGALNPAAWTSIAPANGWQEANPSANVLSELNPLGSAGFAASTSTPLGNVFAPPTPTTIGEETEDITFRFAKPDGGFIDGEVIYTGIPIGTLTLNVDPATGEAQIINGTQLTVQIDNYNILSTSGSLLSGDTDWTSLEDQGTVGDWFEANASADQLSELLATGGLTIAPNGTLDLGTPFDEVSGEQDLEFTFAVVESSLGDFNDNGVVDAADYTVWRDNLGATEDGSVLASNGNGGIVDETDYALWKSNFGMTSSGAGPQFIAGKVVYSPLVTPGAGSLHASTAVPEPATAILTVCGLVMVGSVTCRRR